MVEWVKALDGDTKGSELKSHRPLGSVAKLGAKSSAGLALRGESTESIEHMRESTLSFKSRVNPT